MTPKHPVLNMHNG